jgi:hypothetical protein
MEGVCSSETSVDTQRTTRRYITEVDTLYDQFCFKNRSNFNEPQKQIGEFLEHDSKDIDYISVIYLHLK